MSELDHLSYSSISLYLSCPEAWRRKYVENEPTIASPALVFGSAIHNTVEEYIAGDHNGTIVDLWSMHWENALKRDTVEWGSSTPEHHFNEGYRILRDESIVDELSNIKVQRDADGIAAVEKKVELNVPGVPLPMIGYIDIITEDGIPGDFKTSARSWSANKAANEMQPLFYLAALNQLGIAVPEWKFRHYTIVKTKTPKFEMFETIHSPKELVFLFGMIKQVWHAIESEAFPPNPTGWKCNAQYCDFYANCRGKYL